MHPAGLPSSTDDVVAFPGHQGGVWKVPQCRQWNQGNHVVPVVLNVLSACSYICKSECIPRKSGRVICGTFRLIFKYASATGVLLNLDHFPSDLTKVPSTFQMTTLKWTNIQTVCIFLKNSFPSLISTSWALWAFSFKHPLAILIDTLPTLFAYLAFVDYRVLGSVKDTFFFQILSLHNIDW